MKRIVYLLIALFILTISFSVCPMTQEEKEFFNLAKGGKDTETFFLAALLNDKMASIDLQDTDGNTALMIAIKNQNTAMIDELVKWKPDFSLQNKKGQTALMLAIDTKNVDFVNKILNAFPKDKISQSINRQDDEGNTALMLALKNQNAKMVDALLRLSSYMMELANKKGQTPLMLAIDINNIDFVNKILNTLPTIRIDHLDEDGNTALIHAIKINSVDIIKAILSQVPNTYLAQGGKEANNFAKTDEIKKLLESAEAQYMLWMRIHRFIDGGHLDDPSSDIEKYIAQGASLNVPNSERNPLVAAIKDLNDKSMLELQKKMVKLLLQKGANINLLLKNGATPLIIAAQSSTPEIIKVLLESGQDINAEDRFDWTPLMWAVSKGRIPVIKLFLDANAAMKNSKGDNITEVAELIFEADVDEAKRNEVIKLLEDKEAEISGKKIPVKPATSPDKLLPSLQSLTQNLRMLQAKLTSK